MNLKPVDQLPVYRVDYHPSPFWEDVKTVLDAAPGVWHLAIRHTNPRRADTINNGDNPQMPPSLYVAYCHTHREAGRLRHNVYLRRRPAVSSTPTA